MRSLLPLLLVVGCTVDGGPIDCPSKQRASGRSATEAVLVPATNQIYVLGGKSGGTALDDLWRWSFGSCGGWNRLTTASSPGARADYAAAFDDRRSRIVYVGGAKSNDVWALDTDKLTFSNLVAVGSAPAFIAGQVAAYDDMHDRVIVAGVGTWSIDFGTSDQGLWTSIDKRTVQAPASAVVDPTRATMLVFDPGGLRAFSFLTATWSDVRMQGDIPTAGAKLLWDGVGKQLIAVDVKVATGVLDALATSAVFTTLPTTNDPPLRADPAVAVSGELLWLFGGVDGNGCALDDVWQLDLSTGAWQNVWPATTCL